MPGGITFGPRLGQVAGPLHASRDIPFIAVTIAVNVNEVRVVTAVSGSVTSMQ